MQRVDGHRTGRHRRWWAVLSALALGCAACAAPVPGAPSAAPVPVLSAADVLAQSLRNLGEAGVLHYRGSLRANGNATLGLDVTATATGEAGGSITVGGQAGSLVLVAGTLYIHAPAAFWSALAGDLGNPARAGGRWVTVPPTTLGVDLGAILRPMTLGGSLAHRLADVSGAALADRPSTTVGTTRAIEVALGADAVDVAASEPHGVLRIVAPDGDLGSARGVSLEVSDASATESGVYQDLTRQAQQLRTAVDTSVDIQQGNQSWGACTAAGCSVMVSFTNAGNRPVSVVVRGAWTGDGRPTGSCEAIVGPVAAGAGATATCTDTAPEWATFYQRANGTPGRHPYEVDWTAEALAPPPDLTVLATETGAAGTAPARIDQRTSGRAFVYVIRYQDHDGRSRVWKYGVADGREWRDDAGAQLRACRSGIATSCAVDLVTGTDNRPAADALLGRLVATESAAAGHCPPGQWVACPPTP